MQLGLNGPYLDQLCSDSYNMINPEFWIGSSSSFGLQSGRYVPVALTQLHPSFKSNFCFGFYLTSLFLRPDNCKRQYGICTHSFCWTERISPIIIRKTKLVLVYTHQCLSREIRWNWGAECACSRKCSLNIRYSFSSCRPKSSPLKPLSTIGLKLQEIYDSKTTKH